MVFSYSGWQWTHKNPIQGLNPPAIAQLPLIKVPVPLTDSYHTWRQLCAMRLSILMTRIIT